MTDFCASCGAYWHGCAHRLSDAEESMQYVVADAPTYRDMYSNASLIKVQHDDFTDAIVRNDVMVSNPMMASDIAADEPVYGVSLLRNAYTAYHRSKEIEELQAKFQQEMQRHVEDELQTLWTRQFIEALKRGAPEVSFTIRYMP